MQEQVGLFSAEIQKHLDDKARAKGYDSILSACSYANSTVATFKAEATAFLKWRDDVWSFASDFLAKVEAGTQKPPASVQEFLALLPKLGG